MNLDRIKSTVRAMLNLAADDGATQGEKDNAMAFVQRLMEENNLREEDLADADGVLDSLDNVEVGKANVNLGPKTCTWMAILCMFVQNLLGTVKSYSVKTKDKKGVDCIFYGVLSDCQIAAEIFFETRAIIEREALKRYGGTKRGDGFSYCLGFVTGLNQQLEKVKAANAPPTSNALVVARNAIVVKKNSLAERWAADQGLRLRNHKAKTVVRNRGAFEQGVDDGTNHSVNTDRRKKLTA